MKLITPFEASRLYRMHKKLFDNCEQYTLLHVFNHKERNTYISFEEARQTAIEFYGSEDALEECIQKRIEKERAKVERTTRARIRKGYARDVFNEWEKRVISEERFQEIRDKLGVTTPVPVTSPMCSSCGT